MHSTTSDKDGSRKATSSCTARAEHVTDPARRERHCQVTEQEIGWRPDDDAFHVFSIDIQEVAYTKFGDGDPTIYSWRPGGDLRRLRPGS